MGLMRYSDRDELPLDGARDRETERRSRPGPWAAPTASGPLAARVSLPGSKSLTNRELILAALADGPSVLHRPLHSRDTDLMVQALRSLGAGIHEQAGDGGFGADLRIAPGELEGGVSIDAGLAGTVMRFVPPVAALALGPVAFDGDPAARGRPMRTTIQALRDLGVDVADDGTGSLPFTVHGTGDVEGGELAIDASASSQFVSGLLLAAPRFLRGLTLRHTGERLPSMPHIEMTIATLAARGVTVESPEAGVWIVPPAPIRALDVTIEPDLSNAAPFLAAALVAGGSVTVTGWPASTTQAGDALLELLPLLGATVARDGEAVTVTGGAGISGVDLDLADVTELVPTIAGLAALATTPSRLTGIAHMRGHETDRLAALAADLGALGAHVTEFDDGLAFEPAELHGGAWGAYGDHRMATTGALVGLAVPGVEVDDIGSTAKTLPEFPELWRRMLRGAGGVDPLLWPGI